jgi:hypothetical protein
MMAVLSSKGPKENLHFLGAGLGVVLACLFNMLISFGPLHLYSYNSIDMGPEQLPDFGWTRHPRLLMYWWTALTSTMGLFMFCLWLVDVTRTVFEWTGVVMLALSYLPLLPFFFHHRHERGINLDVYQAREVVETSGQAL